jgi:hypothetical protein
MNGWKTCCMYIQWNTFQPQWIMKICLLYEMNETGDDYVKQKKPDSGGQILHVLYI